MKNFIIFALVFFSSLNSFVFAIGCIKCVSINHDLQSCEDSFVKNNETDNFLESHCIENGKKQDLLFPRNTYCVKITGVFEDNGVAITLRGCASNSGTENTEIVRLAHCNGFYYENRYVRGCVNSCNDKDACNSAVKTSFTSLVFTLFFVMVHLFK